MKYRWQDVVMAAAIIGFLSLIIHMTERNDKKK